MAPDWQARDGRRQPGYRDVQPVRDLVTDEEMFAAMQYLDEVAHPFAEAFAEVDFRTYMLRQVEAIGAQLSDEKANDRRLWDARSSAAYTKAIETLRKAQVAFKEIEAKRAAALLKCEIWRTIRADKRAREVQDGPRR